MKFWKFYVFLKNAFYEILNRENRTQLKQKTIIKFTVT